MFFHLQQTGSTPLTSCFDVKATQGSPCFAQSHFSRTDAHHLVREQAIVLDDVNYRVNTTLGERQD